MSISIRAAQDSDAPDVAWLTTELGYEADGPAVARRLSRILARDDQQFFVADLDGRVVGWVHVAVAEFVELEAFAVIGGLVVSRAHRRTGIGRRLMQAAEAWARDRRCPVVRLWSSSMRTGAHQFCEALGYPNVKTQYSFGKSLDGSTDGLSRFVPRVDESQTPGGS
jgi:GNAT superfamily N-acetyltransferase